ncbi:MAG: cysteine synthase family protein [Chloroflexi bacterium]|nr:cysteine synthase family protein [Chloroflexota bacterium]
MAQPLFPATVAELRRSESILSQIGNTPLVRLRRIQQGRVEIWGKLESFNPGGSVKDRPALRMIEEGERSGALTPDKVIIDATSGNTGIAYALIGAVRGYRVELVMPGNVSEERKQIVEGYGSEVILTDPLEGIDGAIREARRRAEGSPEHYFYPDQYNNPANWQAHYDTTGPEVIAQSEGRLTHFVAGIGTSGTLMGVGRRLREYNPTIWIVEVEPADELEIIEGLKHMATSLVPAIYDPKFSDRKIAVSASVAYHMGRRLAREEGLFVGLSSGAVVQAAIQLAQELSEGVIVVTLPDGGDKYLSVLR